MTEEVVPKTMRVPRFVGQRRIEFVEKPVPQPGPGQLLIRVRANALCGSERGQFLHGAPVTPGHEAAGVVAVAGPETHTLPGTPGVIYLMDFCGVCRSCRQGATNQCLAKRGDIGFNRDGGYGGYALIHENIFFPVTADIPMDEATLLLDIMGTSGHALRRGQMVHPDIQSLLIAGAGPMGLGTLALARLRLGAEIPILVSDMLPYRLALVERLGGTPIALTQQTVEAGVKAHAPAGIDLAIDTSGKQEARQTCLNVLNKRGALVCIGHGEGLTLEVSRDLIGPERAVLGSEYFRYDELPENLALLRTHPPYLRQIITHHFPVTEIQQAFETFFSGETGKVLVEP